MEAVSRRRSGFIFLAEAVGRPLIVAILEGMALESVEGNRMELLVVDKEDHRWMNIFTEALVVHPLCPAAPRGGSTRLWKAYAMEWQKCDAF